MDNWKHRSESMKCRTCMWFVVKQHDDSNRAVEREHFIGRCRKKAPTLEGWPVMFASDWCGDHKLDENKV